MSVIMAYARSQGRSGGWKPGGGGRRWPAIMPPSGKTMLPVTYSASSEARKRAMLATSRGWPGGPRGRVGAGDNARLGGPLEDGPGHVRLNDAGADSVDGYAEGPQRRALSP